MKRQSAESSITNGINVATPSPGWGAQALEGSDPWAFVLSNIFTIVAPSVVTLAIFFYHGLARKHDNHSYPYAGYKGWWEPTWWLRLRFVWTAVEILKMGTTRYERGR